MQLKISHVTEYAYAQPVRYALQRLRLTPQNSPLQTVHSWTPRLKAARWKRAMSTISEMWWNW
jgi:transglutaminase-like putative cysteine protease